MSPDPQGYGRVTFVTSWASRSGGGLFSAMRPLAQAIMRDTGYEITVVSASDEHDQTDTPTWLPVPVSTLPTRGPRSLVYCPSMTQFLQAQNSALIHLHGVWTWPTAACLHWHRTTKKPFVISPHGMLDPWILARGRTKKLIANLLYQRATLNAAACLAALCPAEAAALRQLGLRNPICIIPNGVDLPDPALTAGTTKLKDGRRTLLFLGRLHPKKGVAELILAFAAVMREHVDLRDGWRLVIAGWGTGDYPAQLQRLVNDQQLPEHLSLIGPVFDAQKERLLASSSAFVLPSYSEGLPMAVLEAWSHSLPVLMTEQCNLPEGYAANAAVRIDNQLELLSRQLSDFLRIKESEAAELGRHGRDLVEQRFTWRTIARQYADVYGWLIGGGKRPATLCD